jgi:Ca2+-binding RTX toxin-like protein
VVLMDGVNWTQALEYQWSGWQVVNNAEGQDTFATTLTGTASNDTLTGTSGDDLLQGLGGNDILTGGGGADHFAYSSIGDGLDSIVDFTRGVDGDALDISDVLVGNFVAGWQNPANFVQLVESGGNTTVSVNLDGAGNDFVPLATLQGVTGAVLNDMLAQGNLILS